MKVIDLVKIFAVVVVGSLAANYVHEKLFSKHVAVSTPTASVVPATA